MSQRSKMCSSGGRELKLECSTMEVEPIPKDNTYFLATKLSWYLDRPQWLSLSSHQSKGKEDQNKGEFCPQRQIYLCKRTGQPSSITWKLFQILKFKAIEL